MSIGDIIVGIDAGTTKVCVVVGQVVKKGEIQVLATARSSCTGVKKGVIVDIDAVSVAIKSAIQHVEQKANIKIGSAYVGIKGLHVQLLNCRGSISMPGEQMEITRKDVERAVNSAYNIEIPDDRQVIDILPRQFIVDGYDGIVDPIGMAGSRLDVEVDIVAGTVTAVQSIIKSMEKAGIKVDGILLESLATSEPILTRDEKEMGIAMVDIGASVTDISIFSGGTLNFYTSVPVGGEHITSDIAYGLKIPYNEADRIKRQYGIASVSLIKHDQEITTASINDIKNNTVKISEIVEIIEARVYEIFDIVAGSILKSGLARHINAGIMLTGCGMNSINGCGSIASEITGLPVKFHGSRHPANIAQEFITAYGIVAYVARTKKDNKAASEIKLAQQKKKAQAVSFFDKVKNILNNL